MVRKRNKEQAQKKFIGESVKPKGLDPKAPHKPKGMKPYKSITIQFNEYEYVRLLQGAEVADRKLLDFIRQSLKRHIADLVGD